jgi:hypothetical protein
MAMAYYFDCHGDDNELTKVVSYAFPVHYDIETTQ